MDYYNCSVSRLMYAKKHPDMVILNVLSEISETSHTSKTTKTTKTTSKTSKIISQPKQVR
jgi:hypothetical protein